MRLCPIPIDVEEELVALCNTLSVPSVMQQNGSKQDYAYAAAGGEIAAAAAADILSADENETAAVAVAVAAAAAAAAVVVAAAETAAAAAAETAAVTAAAAAAAAVTAAGTAVVEHYQLHLLSNHVLDLTVSIVFLVMSYKQVQIQRPAPLQVNK